MARLADTFARLRAAARPAFITYVTVGFPTPEATLPAVSGLLAGGTDIIELGVPFSDPLADGPTIQRASFAALEHGTSLQTCLDTAASLRAAGQTAPLLLMGYYNPILRRGVTRFAADAAAAGVDGVIVPDLPPDEAGELLAACRPHGIDVVFLLAPTSSPARIAAVCAVAAGFIYCVSVTGVTGTRNAFDADLEAFIGRVRAATAVPIVIGFGVARPDQFAQMAALADGVVVGSAAIEHLETLPPAGIEAGMRDWARWLAPRGAAVA